MNLSRRQFAASAAALFAIPAAARGAIPERLKLGVCSYSFTNRMKLPDAIGAVKTLGLGAINIKPEFHLPYASTTDEIAAARKMLDDAGVRLVGTGTTYLTKMDEA